MSAALLGQAVVLTLGVGAGSFAIMGSDAKGTRRELAAALEGCRFTAGRLAGFGYVADAGAKAPCPSSRRLARVSQEIHRQAAAPFSFANLAALRLANGEPHLAVEILKTAVEQKQDNAGLWSDLSATYLEAAGQDEPWNLVYAIRAAERALKLDPSHVGARFNYALILDRLYPSELAAEAWRSFLELDSRSGWAEEARRHLAQLGEPSDAELWIEARQDLAKATLQGDKRAVAEIVARFPQQTRLYAEEELLPKWGRLVEMGEESEASRALAIARAIGGALAELGDDHMAADSVGFIDRADSATRGTLAAGHRAFGEGNTTYRKDFGRAAAAFAESRKALANAGSPFEAWVVYHEAKCAFQRGAHARVFMLLSEVTTPDAMTNYPSLAGKSFWLMGLSRVTEGRVEEALPFYLDALRLYELLGEIENVTAVRNLTAEAFRHLGDHRRAWSYLAPVLRGIRGMSEPDRAQGMLQEAAGASLALGEPTVALVFQTERVQRLGPSPDATLLALALHERAVVRELAGEREGALADLSEALDAAEAIGDVVRRDQVLAYLFDTQGRLTRWASPSEAVESFSRSIASWGSLGNRRVLPGLLLHRGRAYLDLVSNDLAERDLLAAVAELEQQAAGSLDTTLATTFQQQQREALAALVRLSMRRGETARAFAYAEHRRSGRAVLSATSEHEARQTFVQALSGVAPNTAVVAYLALEDRVLTWVVRAGRLRLVEQGITRRDLERLVLRLRRDLEELTEHGSSAGRELYRLLVAPLAEELRGSDTLVIIPDGVLQPVPFGALVDPATGRYLVESHQVTKAPSIEFLARADGRAAAELGEPTVLVVGDPAFGREAFEWLSRLPAAEREAREVVRIFPHAVALVAEDATKDRFMEQAAVFDVLHFAGHAILNEKRPEKSGLLFAPGTHPGGSVLTVEEIEGMPLAGTRLVVLSACGTADGALAAGEGAMSLARAFLAAGAPEVVASLWQVGDDPTTDLITLFYRQLHAGRPPLAALRDAQLQMIGQERPVRDWAAFELIGAVSTIQED